jgi:hypothetical protein
MDIWKINKSINQSISQASPFFPIHLEDCDYMYDRLNPKNRNYTLDISHENLRMRFQSVIGMGNIQFVITVPATIA